MIDRSAALAAALLLVSAPLRAAEVEPDSEWDHFVAEPTTPGSPIGPTTPEGGFSAPEQVRFGERMRERVLDQLCRNLRVTVNYNLSGDFSGTGTGLRRYLAPLPDGRLTVVDEERLSVGYGHAFSKLLGSVPGPSAGVWVGGRLEGASMVIRPLRGKQTCDEVDTLIDLRDIKTVLPFKAQRVQEMKVGELWRMPFRLTVGHSEGLAHAVDDLTVSLTFNGTEAGAATLTVYRLSEKQLRFRFRVDRVEIRTKGAQLAKTIPALEFASLGENILAQFVDKRLAKELNHYTSASLGLAWSKQKGKRVVLEYVVDPTDPAQAESVAQALHGDFRSLVKMGWRMGTQQASDASTEEAYRELQRVHDKELGPAQFAAINAYNQKARDITLNLPLLTYQHWNTLKGDDTMTRYTDVQGDIHFQRADKSQQSEWLRMPWVGPLVKNQVQRDVQVVTAAKKGDPWGDPIIVYLQQYGFLRDTESSVREKAQEFSDIAALVGTRGGGPNPRMRIPLSAAQFPEPPAPVESADDGTSQRHDPSDRKGSMAFTFVFSQAGVKQLLSASAEDVVKAYAAVAEAKPAMTWLLENGRMRADGSFAYDRNAVRKAFPDPEGRSGGVFEEGEMDQISREAAGLVADLFIARDAANNQTRSEALMRAFGGLGKSKLGYEKAMRVYVQLVDPQHVTADFVARVERSKKEKETDVHFVLKRGRPENPLLELAGQAKARFAEPSILTD